MSSQYAPIAVLAILVLGFWLVVLRPARRSQLQTSRLQSKLAVGDEVILSAGIFGTIQALEDSRVKLEIAPGTVITVARQVVVRRVEDLPDSSDQDHNAQDRPAAGEE